MVRITHWLTVISFVALLITGAEIVISHPRFYWGETGNVNMHPLFTLHIPSSRDTVPTGYGFVMPDQMEDSESNWSLVKQSSFAEPALQAGRSRCGSKLHSPGS